MLVVIAIIAILSAILFPVFAKARAKGRQAASTSNLRQIGIAIALYRTDYDETNPRYRLCPDDIAYPLCENAMPTVPTGPNETWWAPFDAALTPDVALPASAYTGRKAGMLQPYVKSFEIFQGPGYDGQIGYAMSYITAGPMGRPDAEVVNPTVLQVWEHARTPGCADTSVLPHAPGTPWNPFPFAKDTKHTHYPYRHVDGGFMALRYDGSVKFTKPQGLGDNDFSAIIKL